MSEVVQWIVGVALPAMAGAIILVWRHGNKERRDAAISLTAERNRCDAQFAAISKRFEDLAEKRTQDYVALLRDSHSVTERNTAAFSSVAETLDKVLDKLTDRITRP